MNKELFEALDRISDKVFDIEIKTKAINDKLDELIKALHEYDDDQLHCEYSGLPSVKAYGESSFEAFMDTKGGPCSKHDEASWDEIETNKRMDVIGQNGNTGEHYTDVDENEFNDYGERVVKGNNNNSDKHNTVVEKKRNNGRESGLKAMGEGQPKQKRYYKNNRSKRNDNKK